MSGPTYDEYAHAFAAAELERMAKSLRLIKSRRRSTAIAYDPYSDGVGGGLEVAAAACVNRARKLRRMAGK